MRKLLAALAVALSPACFQPPPQVQQPVEPVPPAPRAPPEPALLPGRLPREE